MKNTKGDTCALWLIDLALQKVLQKLSIVYNLSLKQKWFYRFFIVFFNRFNPPLCFVGLFRFSANFIEFCEFGI